MRDVLVLVGEICVLLATTTGGYTWLRWGWTGVKAIWQSRHELDDQVRHDVERTVIR